MAPGEFIAWVEKPEGEILPHEGQWQEYAQQLDIHHIQQHNNGWQSKPGTLAVDAAVRRATCR